MHDRALREWVRRFGALRLVALVAAVWLCFGSRSARAHEPISRDARAETTPATDPAVADASKPKAAEEPRILKIEPAEAIRGTPVTVLGEFLPENVDDVAIQVGSLEIGHPAYVAEDRKSLVFVVPLSVPREDKLEVVPLGRSLVRVIITSKVAGRQSTVPHKAGYLTVTPENPTPLRLTKAHPTVVNPDTRELILIGEGMGGLGEDYALLKDGEEIPLCWTDGCSGHRARFSSPFQLEISGPFDASWDGPRQIGIRAGHTTAPGGVEVRFTSYRRSEIRNIALLVSGCILLLMISVAWGGGGAHSVGTTRYVARALLIDTETDAYSLSKLQFYLWSGAALIGYSYLTLSRTLAQGQLEIADFPENLPGILAISGGTAIASIGITQVRGPKASCRLRPSFGDLINTGGVVSPERFQFLLWTVVAVATFLFNVFRSDPTSISELPEVPEGLLMLSGVSAAGYLGGRLVRSPGPVLDEVLASAGSLTLTLLGRNLSVDASFEINGRSVTEYLTDKVLRPEIVERETDEGGAAFAKKIQLKLDRVPKEWLDTADKSLEFTIINRDGQRAMEAFKLGDELRRKLLQGPAEPVVPALPSAGGS